MRLSRRRLVLGAGAVLTAPAPVRDVRAEAAPREHHVAIRNFRFGLADVTAAAGDVIVWTNHDIAPHTATADDDSWDSGTLRQGDTFRLAVSPGMTGRYYCRFHPMMKAVLTVAGAAG